MLKIGIIGAGSISESHIKPYTNNSDCIIKAIADINISLAKAKAKEYGISDVYDDYRKILDDKEIDAVSILTPTFTHKQIVCEAIKSGKHVLCEKPPAMNADETRECVELAKKSDKCIMYGLVCRFGTHMQYLKEFVDKGKMGKIITVDAQRMFRCVLTGGWMNSKKMAGGPLLDAAIHELDSALYLMGYPEPKAVMGFTSNINKDFPERVKSWNFGWRTSDNNQKYERDVENIASGYVTFKNGASLYIKTSTVANTVSEGTFIEICGEKAGVKLKPFVDGEELTFVDVCDDYMREFRPVVEKQDFTQTQINHFVDCCLGRCECICKLDDVIALMEIMDAIYKSAETGMPVIF